MEDELSHFTDASGPLQGRSMSDENLGMPDPGRGTRTVACLQAELAQAKRAGETEREIDLLVQIARVAEEASDFGLANMHLDIAARVIRKSGKRRERLPEVLGDRALLLRRCGRLKQALEGYRQAEAAAEDCRSPVERARYVGKQGAVLRLLNEAGEAREAFMRARDLFAALGTEGTEGLADQEGNLGLLAADDGDSAEAEAAYRRAVTLAGTDDGLLSTWACNLGNALARQRRYAAAAVEYERALAAAKRAGDQRNVYQAAVAWADACRSAHRSAERIEILSRAAEEMAAPGARADLLERCAYDLKLLRRWDKLAELCFRLEPLLAGPDAEARMDRCRADARLAAERLAEAHEPAGAEPPHDATGSRPFERFLSAWMARAMERNDHDALRDAAHLVCDIAFALGGMHPKAWGPLTADASLGVRVLGDVARALVEAERPELSLEISQRWKCLGFCLPNLARLRRSSAPVPEAGGVLEGVAELSSAVERLCQADDREVQLCADTVRRAGESLLERHELLRDRDPVLAARLGAIVRAGDLRASLPKDSPLALLDLLATREMMLIHVLTAEGQRVRVRGALAPGLDLTELYRLTRVWTEGHVATEVSERQRQALLDIGSSLHDGMFCRLAALLAELHVTQIVLVPDLLTRHLPLHLAGLCFDNVKAIAAAVQMKDPPTSAALLCEVFPVEYLPCLQAMVVSQSQKRPRALSRALSLADPFSNLPQARATARYLEEQLRGTIGTATSIGPDATLARLRAGLEKANIVVLGCHGHFDGRDPTASSLELADGPWTCADMIDEQALTTSPVVVLSACEVGAVAPTPVDVEAGGIPGALLSAGAACVLAPLWPVEDLSIGFLVERFMHHLAYPGYRPSAALFRALYDLRRLTKDTAVEMCLKLMRQLQDEGLDEQHPEEYAALGRMMRALKEAPRDYPFDTAQLWGSIVLHGSGWPAPAGAFVGSSSISRELIDDHAAFVAAEGHIHRGELAEARRALEAFLPRTEGLLRGRTLYALAHVVFTDPTAADAPAAPVEARRLLNEAAHIARNEQDERLLASVNRLQRAVDSKAGADQPAWTPKVGKRGEP